MKIDDQSNQENILICLNYHKINQNVFKKTIHSYHVMRTAKHHTSWAGFVNGEFSVL